MSDSAIQTDTRTPALELRAHSDGTWTLAFAGRIRAPESFPSQWADEARKAEIAGVQAEYLGRTDVTGPERWSLRAVSPLDIIAYAQSFAARLGTTFVVPVEEPASPSPSPVAKPDATAARPRWNADMDLASQASRNAFVDGYLQGRIDGAVTAESGKAVGTPMQRLREWLQARRDLQQP